VVQGEKEISLQQGVSLFIFFRTLISIVSHKIFYYVHELAGVTLVLQNPMKLQRLVVERPDNRSNNNNRNNDRNPRSDGGARPGQKRPFTPSSDSGGK